MDKEPKDVPSGHIALQGGGGGDDFDNDILWHQGDVIAMCVLFVNGRCGGGERRCADNRGVGRDSFISMAGHLGVRVGICAGVL